MTSIVYRGRNAILSTLELLYVSSIKHNVFTSNGRDAATTTGRGTRGKTTSTLGTEEVAASNFISADQHPLTFKHGAAPLFECHNQTNAEFARKSDKSDAARPTDTVIF